MGDLSRNFSMSEFRCKGEKCGRNGNNCGEKRISPTVVLICQLVRDRFGMPVTVTSGCRCTKHNEDVGGAENSQHKPKGDGLCHGADIRVMGVNPQLVYNYLNGLFPNSLGLGNGKSFTHIDDRMDRAYRWEY